MLEIIQLPVLDDNYIFLINDPDSGDTAVVDPALAQPVLDELEENNWHLSYVFNTHHHWDHTGGNLELKQKTGCKIIGAENDQQRIPGIDRLVRENDQIKLGKHPITIFETPGHTRGHIVYYFPKDNLLFCGDTLFVMGCGRLFEGTPEQMWHSLKKLKALPGPTNIYCTHEYTQANARFALTMEPNNRDLIAKAEKVNQLRAQGLPTVPSTITEEIATNPFFRANSPEIQETLTMQGESEIDVFTEIRKRKDKF